MDVKTFVPEMVIPALEWLGNQPSWFHLKKSLAGVRDLNIILPQPDHKVDPEAYDWLHRWVKGCERARVEGKQGKAELGTIYTSVRIVKEGPKVFYPTAEQCEAMLNVEIDVPKEYYRQPYPTFIIYFPHSFVAKQAALSPTQRFPRWGSLTTLDAANVVFVRSQYDDWSGLGNVVSLDTPGTIEEAINLRNHIDGPESEYNDNQKIQRLMVNFAMMLTNYQHTLKAKDEQAFNAFQGRLGKKGLDPAKRLNLLQKKRWLVQEIVTEKATKFYDEIRSKGEAGEGEHATPRPHWRRGYWRREMGYRAIISEGRKPKIIFIKPVLVNGHLIDGKGPIQAIYKAAKRGGSAVTMPV